MKTFARYLLGTCLVACVAAVSGPALAGTECETQLWNSPFPGPSYVSGDFASTIMQLAMTRSTGDYTAYVSWVMEYSASNGTSVSATDVPVAFSDRAYSTYSGGGLTPNCADGYHDSNCQGFKDSSMDSWNITVTEVGLITVTNNTWGGTVAYTGSCTSTQKQIVAQSSTTTGVLLIASFEAPIVVTPPK